MQNTRVQPAFWSMPMRPRDDEQLRSLLTQECARIMIEQGVKDFALAKRKAAERFGVPHYSRLPSNSEIEQALCDYQRLFKPSIHSQHLRLLRQQAAQAMRFLQRFRPRLVGSVLAGTASEHSDINLHLFADTPEDVLLFLMEHNIPFENGQRRIRLANGDTQYYPTLAFRAGDYVMDLTVFPSNKEREAPRSPVDGKPMKRAHLSAVESLLAE